MPPLPIRLRDPMLVNGAIGGVIAPRGPKPSAAPNPLLVAQAMVAPGESLKTLGAGGATVQGGAPVPDLVAFTNQNTSAANLNVTKPAGTQDRDFIILQVEIFVGGGEDIVLSSFTDDGFQLLEPGRLWRPSVADSLVYIFTKVADSEPGTWAFTKSGAGGGWTIIASGWRGVDPINPIDTFSGRNQNGGSPITGTSITPSSDECLIVAIGTLRDNPANSSPAESDPDGYATAYNIGSSLHAAAFALAYKGQEKPEATGALAFVCVNHSSSRSVVHILALRPYIPVRGFPIESLQKVVSTSASPGEGGGPVTQTGSFPDESLQGIQALKTLPGESSAIVRALATEPGEWLLRVLAPSAAFAGELLQGLASLDTMPAESLQKLAVSALEPGESAAPVQALAVEPGEWLLKVLAPGAPSPVEALQGVRGTIGTPGEAAAGVAATSPLPGESAALIKAISGVLAGEWLTLVKASSAEPGESLAALAAMAAGPGEALGTLLVPVLLPAEKLAGVASVGTFPGEAGSPAAQHDVASVASFPIEILAGVGKVAILPGEIRTGGVLYRVGVVSLEVEQLAAVGLQAVPAAIAELAAAAAARAVLVAEPL